MTATPILTNRLRSTVEWLDDNGAHLPGDWGFLYSLGRVSLHWHDEASADYTRSRLEHWFGPGVDDSYCVDGSGQTSTSWPAEGARPELVVFHTTVRVTS